ncbi:MAG: hypothetical protein IKT85_01985 [Kiritimatiellae bacterium]|nr:hypothetical protein [Kiritimatiellia bacterium]
MKRFALLLLLIWGARGLWADQGSAQSFYPITHLFSEWTEVERWRITFAGVGRFGSELSLIDTPLNYAHERYGATMDTLFNLLPRETFNLWFGLGATYMPEQEIANYAFSDHVAIDTFTVEERILGAAFDVRLMLLPEWRLTPTVALGLRLGIGLCHYSGRIATVATRVEPTSNAPLSGALHHTYAQSCFRTLLGAQVLWTLSDHFSALIYCQAYLGDRAEVQLKGTTIGEVNGLSAEVGIGLTYAF